MKKVEESNLINNIKHQLSDEEIKIYSRIYKVLLLSKMICLEMESKDFKISNERLLNRLRAAYNHLHKLPNEITKTIKADFAEIFPEYDEEKMYLLMDIFCNSIYQTEEQLKQVAEISNKLKN